MDYCQYFYGISERDIQAVCLISPLPFKLSQLGVEVVVHNKSQGRFGRAYQCPGMTLIQTFIGAIFVADAVLSLRHSPVKSLFFIGSAGLTFPSRGLDIGSVVLPDPQIALDSLAPLLDRDSDAALAETRPDAGLSEQVRGGVKTHPQVLRRVRGASFASLILEEEYLPFFKEKHIQIIDMECATFYASAMYIGKKAVGLMYISDIIQAQPFYSAQANLDEKKSSALRYLFELTSSFAQADLR